MKCFSPSRYLLEPPQVLPAGATNLPGGIRTHWKQHAFHGTLGNQSYSLNDIEHKVLRKMGEPRIHFAIVCASIGCPRLLGQAYTPDKVQKQLELNAKDFFQRSSNFRYDQAKGRFYLSAILDWFGKDFGNNQAAQLRTIAPWLPTEAPRTAALENRVKVSYLDYNWQLNEQSTR